MTNDSPWTVHVDTSKYHASSRGDAVNLMANAMRQYLEQPDHRPYIYAHNTDILLDAHTPDTVMVGYGVHIPRRRGYTPTTDGHTPCNISLGSITQHEMYAGTITWEQYLPPSIPLHVSFTQPHRRSFGYDGYDWMIIDAQCSSVCRITPSQGPNKDNAILLHIPRAIQPDTIHHIEAIIRHTLLHSQDVPISHHERLQCIRLLDTLPHIIDPNIFDTIRRRYILD